MLDLFYQYKANTYKWYCCSHNYVAYTLLMQFDIQCCQLAWLAILAHAVPLVLCGLSRLANALRADRTGTAGCFLAVGACAPPCLPESLSRFAYHLMAPRSTRLLLWCCVSAVSALEVAAGSILAYLQNSLSRSAEQAGCPCR